jgi:hypothetical protein
MASIRKEIVVEAKPEQVWDAVRDVGAIHTRLAPGFVVDTKLDGDARVVTFGNGMVLRELLVSVDDQARRLVWAAVADHIQHHSASMQVIAEGGSTRLVWIADVLPHALGQTISGLMDQALGIAKPTLERAS